MLELFLQNDLINPDILEEAIRTANIVSDELGLDSATYWATVLFMLSGESREKITENFSDEVRQILDDALKIEAFPQEKYKDHLEKYIKLILTSISDVRAIFVLIAKYLHLIRQFETLSDLLKKEVLEKNKFLYQTIAHRLGLYKIKKELEERILQIENPQVYEELSRKIRSLHRSVDTYIKNFIAEVDELIKPLGYKYKIKGRIKSVSSVWRKMQRKGVSFEEVFDIFAIRIILDVEQDREIAACWDVFSVVTNKYPYHPKRLRDWLTVPKSNGYMSLHVTVLGPDERWVELQIRSVRMDEVAEKGLAAHWKYKEYSKDDKNKEDLFGQIRKAIENPVQSSAKPEIKADEIYVFTPKGDLIELPRGATVLDFAFHIHSEVGAHCIGGVVDGKFQSFTYELKNGQQVKVLTSKSQEPKKEWLDIVKSARAKRKIKQLLVRQQYKWIQIGREAVQRKFSRQNIEYNSKNLEKIAKALNFGSVAEFFEAVGDSRIDLQNVDFLHILYPPRDEEKYLPEKQTAEKSYNPLNFVIISNKVLDGVDYKIAQCCKPQPGDNVVVLKTLNGLVLHKVGCKVAKNYVLSQTADKYFFALWKPKQGRYKFLKVRFRYRGKEFSGSLLEKILKALDIQLIRFRVFRKSAKGRALRGYFIIKPIGEAQKEKLADILKKNGFVKLGFYLTFEGKTK